MLNSLLEEQDTISAGRLSQFKGQIMTVLVEESGSSYSLGRAYNSAPDVDGVVVLKGHNEDGVLLKRELLILMNMTWKVLSWMNLPNILTLSRMLLTIPALLMLMSGVLWVTIFRLLFSLSLL